MPDNVTIDNHGHLVILEDPGADNYVAKVFGYDIATNQLAAVAQFDPLRFDPANVGTFMTNDEETSGVFDTESTLGANTFLLDAQVHTATGLTNPTAQVEHGQYLKSSVDFAKVFSGPTPVVPESPLIILLPGTA